MPINYPGDSAIPFLRKKREARSKRAKAAALKRERRRKLIQALRDLRGKSKPVFSEEFIMLLSVFIVLHNRPRKHSAPNKLEQLFDQLTPNQVRFVGDGGLWVALPNGKRKNPDFEVVDQRKVIELFGDRWHRVLNYTDPEALIQMFWRVGIECLVIWESQFHENRDGVIETVRDFLG
jgi:hypothetical protein